MISMKLEIIRKKDMFCLETALSTICNHFGIPYQMLFARTWGYDYKGDDLCIGNNINIIDWQLVNNIKKFGIEEEEIDEAAAKDLEYIRCKLRQGKLAMVSMDMVKFNELNETSYIGLRSPYLLYDYDNGFIAYDLHYTHESIRISDEVFQNACRKIIFYGVGAKGASFVFQYDLKEIHKVLIPSKPDFEKIEHLANLFDGGAVNLEYETKDLAEGDDPVYAPIIRKIETLARGRNLFSMYLDYVNSLLPEIDVTEECEKVSYWAGKWNIVKVILIKAYYKKDFSQDVMKKIALIIYDIAQGERELYEQLLRVNNKEFKEIDNKFFKSDENVCLNEIKSVEVDLLKLCNNAGVKLAGTDKKADMTGLGAYIEYDEKQLEKAAFKHKGFYNFCDIVKRPLDNILCQGQKISIPVGVYRRVYILGCSDYGSFSDYLTICYENMEEKNIIQFSSWINKQPLFDEQVYCTGKLKEINVRLHQSEGTLFTQSIELLQQRVHSIKLPNCPTMHIFSIYLR